MLLKFLLESYLNHINAPAHPYVTDTVVYTALLVHPSLVEILLEADIQPKCNRYVLNFMHTKTPQTQTLGHLRNLQSTLDSSIGRNGILDLNSTQLDF